LLYTLKSMTYLDLEVPFGDPRILPGGEYAAVPIDEKTIALGQAGLLGEVELISQYPAPRVEPLCYPGRKPETSFVLGEESRILPMTVVDDPKSHCPRFFMATESGTISIDDALEKAGLTPMAERIPVVTFGSNANPGQLASKFSKQEDKDSYFIPTTKALVHDLVPVYVPKVGMWKYSFAAMYQEDGVKTEVAINWLTPAQLAHMHTTERAYTFSQFGTAELDGSNLEIPAYLYVGKDSVYIDEFGRPVRLDECKTTGSELRVAGQTEMQVELFELTEQALIAQYPHIKEHGITDLHAMIDSMHDHALKKVDVGKTMAAALTDSGRVANISLLEAIPAEHQDITPKTLGEIIHGK
jgi:hypothetical protein